jgi:serine/threonine-protein kinase
VTTDKLEFAKTVTPHSSQPSASSLPRQPCVEIPPGTLVGDYRIEAKLGEGGMGCVYAATHALLGKKAAIKVLGREPGVGARTQERVLDEARAVNELGHPNIVEIFAFGSLEDGRQYMVMDRLSGVTLAQRLKQGCLSLEEAGHVMDQVCRALQAVHERGVVHRDLKPENVFLVDVGTRLPLVKLLDFGIAKLAHGGKGQRDTLAGSMVGTPLYVSPEAARGLGVDARTDIYSLGVMIYEAVLDRPPFQGRTAVDTIAMHLHDEPPRPSELWPGVPRPLEDLLLRMLAKEPDGRPGLAQVRTVMADIQRVRDEGGEGRPPSAVIRVPPPVAPTTPASTAVTPEPQRQSGALQAVTPAPAAPPAAPPQPDETAQMPAALPPARERPGPWKLVVAITVIALGAVVFLAWPRGPAVRDVPPPPFPATVDRAADAAATSGVAGPASAPLPRRPAVGTLVVRPSVPGARVVIDGQEVGLVAGAARQPSAAPGWHEVTVTAPGHVPLSTKIQVAAGARVEVPVTLVPEPQPRRTPARRDPKAPPPAAPPTKRPPPAPTPPADDMPIDPFGKKR